MKYIAPRYENYLVMTRDIITESIVAVTTHSNGVTENIVNLYEGEGDNKTLVGQKSSFEFSVNKFFGSQN